MQGLIIPAIPMVAQIADYLYVHNFVYNYSAFDYLYTDILSQLNPENLYYRNERLEYGWDTNLIVPAAED